MFFNNKKNTAKGKKSDNRPLDTTGLLEDDFFTVDSGMKSIEISQLGIKQGSGQLPTGQKSTQPVKLITGIEQAAQPEDSTGTNEDSFFVLGNNKKPTPPPKVEEIQQPRTGRKTVTLDYGLDNIPEGVSSHPNAPHTTDGKKACNDGSADAVFGSDFDPFKLAMSEELAHKPSSRAAATSRPVVSERISEITEEDVRRARQQAEAEMRRERERREFDRRKAEYLANLKKASPQSDKDNANEEDLASAEPDIQNNEIFIADNKQDATAIPNEAVADKAEEPSIYRVPFGSVATQPSPEAATKNPVSEQDLPRPSFASELNTATAPAAAEKRSPYSFTPRFDTAERTGNATVTDPSRRESASDRGSVYRRVAEFSRASMQTDKPYAAPNQNSAKESYFATAASNEQKQKTDSYSFGASYGEINDITAKSSPSHTTEGSCNYGFGQSYPKPDEQVLNSRDAYYSMPDSDESDDACRDCNTAANEFDSLAEPDTEGNDGFGFGFDLSEDDGIRETDLGFGSDYEEDGGFGFDRSDKDGQINEYETELPDDKDDAAFPMFRNYEVPDSSEDEGGLSFEINESIPSANPTPLQTLMTERTAFGGFDEGDDFGENEEDDDEVGELTDDTPDSTELFDPEDATDNITEIPEDEQNPDVIEMRRGFAAILDEDEGESSEELDGSYGYGGDAPSAKTDNAYTYPDDDSAGFSADTDEDCEEMPPFDEPVRVNTAKEPKTEDKPVERKKIDYSYYKAPPLDLLAPAEAQNDEDIALEMKENTKTIIDTLASFHVTASIKGVDRGPRITRYEVVPAKGVKVNQITNLFDDIKLYLAAEGVRMEAPIPGKSAIGFEIPNKKPVTVRLRELLECDEFVNAKSNTFVCIGKDVAGNPVFGDIGKFPHALIAGATGMGKSVAINSVIISMLYKARPDQVKFIMIDPKKVEFKMYSGIPHLLIPVITEAKQAAGALMWAVEEMERRYDLIEKLNIRNIDAYNERQLHDPSIGEYMPKIIVVIDELNDLMMQVRDPVEDLIMRIAQKARAAGIHLIIGTQRPDVKVITGTIKANINTRISCKVTSVQDSRTILEMSGAEKLLDKGDMLFKPVDKTKPVRVQSAFVSDHEVESIMDFLKNQSPEEQYDDAIFAEINKAAQKCGNKKGERSGGADLDIDDDARCGYYNDQQFLDAVEMAIRMKKVSTSLLQRKMSIGYSKAAKFIDGMEELGVVSPTNGSKPREVLMTLDEWYEKLERVSDD